MVGLRPRAPGPSIAVRPPPAAVEVVAPAGTALTYAPRNWALTAGAVLLILVLVGGLIWLIVYLATRGSSGGQGGGGSVPYPQWNPGSTITAPVTIRNPAGSYYMYADKGLVRLTRAFGDGWVWRIRDTDGKFILGLETKNGSSGYLTVSSRGLVGVTPSEAKATALRGYLANPDKQEVIFATDAAKPLFLANGSNNVLTTTSRLDKATRFVIVPAAPTVQERPAYQAPAPAPVASVAVAAPVPLQTSIPLGSFPPLSTDRYA